MIGYCGQLKQEVITEADCFYCKHKEIGYTCLFLQEKKPKDELNENSRV